MSSAESRSPARSPAWVKPTLWVACACGPLTMLVAPWSAPSGYAFVPFVLMGQLLAAVLSIVVLVTPGHHRVLPTLWGLLAYSACVAAGLVLKQNWLDSAVSILAVVVLAVALARALLVRAPTCPAESEVGHAWDQFMYVAWFRDHQFPPDDQDAEWPACIVIRAPSASDAKAWGDLLARDMCARKPQESFLWSRVDMRDDPTYSEQAWAEGPEVRFGQWASDKEIGW